MADKDYSGTPLARKLGIKSGSRVAFVDAPGGFVATLELPPDVELAAEARADLDVAIVFVTRLKDLRARFPEVAEAVYPAGGLWVAYPKKSSTIEGDLNFDNVQQLGLDEGLADNKSCAIDDDYSGLRFVYRVEDR